VNKGKKKRRKPPAFEVNESFVLPEKMQKM